MANSATVGVLRALLTLDSAEFEAGIRRVNTSAKSLTKDLKSFGLQASQVGAALTKTITLPIVALGAASAKAAMDFESSFANVAKTVDGVSDKAGTLTAAGKQLAQTFRDMAKEIPATTEELTAIAALGGQMGVPIDQLAHFTRNVAALGVAVDGISTEDAAAGLAQIGNITGTGTKNIAQMASALVHLGNSSSATESDILEFTKRLAGAGHSVGMAVPEIMALGTAMANVGINAEAGGTAMSQVITKMSVAVSEGGAKLSAFAEVARVSAETFAQTWRSSPIEAIDLFVKGLSQTRKEGGDLNLTMGELGTEGIRIADTLKRLSGATDGVSASLKIANEGFVAGNKHLEEAEKKYATTANQLKVLWNQIKDVGITIGNALLPVINQLVAVARTALIPAIEHAAKIFTEMPVPLQLAALGIAGVAAAIGPLLFIAGQLALSISAVTAAFTANGIATRALAAGQTLLTGTTTRLTGALGLLSKASLLVGGAWVAWEASQALLRGHTDRLAASVGDLTEVSEKLAAAELKLAQARAGGDRTMAGLMKAEVDALKARRDAIEAAQDAVIASEDVNLANEEVVVSQKAATVHTRATTKATKDLTKAAEEASKRFQDTFIYATQDMTDAIHEMRTELDRARDSFDWEEFGHRFRYVTNDMVDAAQDMRLELDRAFDWDQFAADFRYATQDMIDGIEQVAVQTAVQTRSIWDGVASNVGRVLDTLDTSMQGTFAQMMLGAKGFRDGFIDIWQSIKAALTNIFAQILGTFTQGLLNGMVSALTGSAGGFSRAFAGMIPGLAGSAATGAAGAGAGAGAAGAGAGAGLGISSAALIGLTAGVGAAIVAAYAIYRARRNDAKKAREEFAEALGFESLHDLNEQLSTMGERGQELRRIGESVIGKKDAAANKRWMEDVARLFEATEKLQRQFGALGDTVAAFGGRVPSALKPMLDAILGMTGATVNLTAEQRALLEQLGGEADWKVVQQKMQDYGIAVSAAGEKFQQARISETALQYARDLQFFADAGLDAGLVLQGMADELSALVIDAMASGAALPETLRPYIEELIRTGQLVDENGEALTDFGNLRFADILDPQLTAITELLQGIHDLLAGIGPTAKRGVEEVNSAWGGLRQPRIVPEFDWSGFSGPAGFGADFVPIMDEPIQQVVRSGFAWLNPGDIAGMPGLTPDVVGGGGMMTVIVQAEGREMARIVTPYIPGEVKRLGLTRI